jgi:energy-coupling factor transporter ATP-binding protein EcfA2
LLSVDALCIFGLKGSILDYTYWAYGLKVGSQLPFPELLPLQNDDPCDLTIAWGSIPVIEKTLNGFHSEAYDITPTHYRITIKDVASYFVQDGKTIFIEAHENADQETIRLFCLSSAFAAALHQRKTIPIHCAALIDNGELVLILGNSGAGKSTTMASLIQQGLKPFSDDVCVPLHGSEAGQISLYSSYPMMKFWKETLELVGLENDVHRKIRPDMEKYGIYFHQSFLTEALDPKLIILLEKSDQVSSPVLTQISGIELFTRLESNAYRGEYLSFSDLKKEHFMLFTQLANQSVCYLLKRPLKGNFVDEVAQKIINLLN